jgi:acetylornithine deacetylase/succinyl-diaminopimelate desuccinylase-like protein
LLTRTATFPAAASAALNGAEASTIVLSPTSAPPAPRRTAPDWLPAVETGAVETECGWAGVLERVRAYRAGARWRILTEFAGLLALENVTGDLPALRRNATAIAAMFAERGVAVEVVEQAGVAPVVVGRVVAGEGRPTLGVYAHYDGQPVDAGRWRSPPFQPVLRDAAGEPVPFGSGGDPVRDDWRLFARAAADDKAPLMALLAALDALHAAGLRPAVNLVFCFEGEEESGSPHLRAYLEQLRDRLRADVWLICDGPVHQSGAPQVVLGARGYCGFELTVYGPNRELHSGHYGNWAPNPALALAHLLASAKDTSGTVTIDGFYDLTRPPTAVERAMLADLPAVETDLLDTLDLAAAEVPGSRLVDRLMLPSLNIRGITAADVGPAARNVIPERASASVDIRLAAGDDPARMLHLVRQHLTRQGFHVLDREPTPLDRRAHPHLARLDPHLGYPAARAPADLPILAHLAQAATRAAGRPAVIMPTLGGSVPLHDLADALATPTVLLPIANHDNNQHAANENLRVGQLWYAIDLLALLLTTTPDRPPGTGRRGAGEPAR